MIPYYGTIPAQKGVISCSDRKSYLCIVREAWPKGLFLALVGAPHSVLSKDVEVRFDQRVFSCTVIWRDGRGVYCMFRRFAAGIVPEVTHEPATPPGEELKSSPLPIEVAWQIRCGLRPGEDAGLQGPSLGLTRSPFLKA